LALRINELTNNLPSFFGCHAFQFTKLLLDERLISTDGGVEGAFIHSSQDFETR
jgi:hypothetical protein